MLEQIEQIKAHPVYQQVLRDSMGGIMYNVANRNKYDDQELIGMWNSMSPGEQEACDGIMTGVFMFLTEEV